MKNIKIPPPKVRGGGNVSILSLSIDMATNFVYTAYDLENVKRFNNEQTTYLFKQDTIGGQPTFQDNKLDISTIRFFKDVNKTTLTYSPTTIYNTLKKNGLKTSASGITNVIKIVFRPIIIYTER